LQVRAGLITCLPAGRFGYLTGRALWVGGNYREADVSDYWKAITRWKLLLDPGTYIH
jgi:hypothetical protein